MIWLLQMELRLIMLVLNHSYRSSLIDRHHHRHRHHHHRHHHRHSSLPHDDDLGLADSVAGGQARVRPGCAAAQLRGAQHQRDPPQVRSLVCFFGWRGWLFRRRCCSRARVGGCVARRHRRPGGLHRSPHSTTFLVVGLAHAPARPPACSLARAAKRRLRLTAPGALRPVRGPATSPTCSRLLRNGGPRSSTPPPTTTTTTTKTTTTPPTWTGCARGRYRATRARHLTTASARRPSERRTPLGTTACATTRGGGTRRSESDDSTEHHGRRPATTCCCCCCCCSCSCLIMFCTC